MRSGGPSELATGLPSQLGQEGIEINISCDNRKPPRCAPPTHAVPALKVHLGALRGELKPNPVA